MASLGYGIFFVLSSLHAYFTQTTMIVSDLTDNIKPVYLYMYWCMQFDLTDKKTYNLLNKTYPYKRLGCGCLHVIE